MNCEKKFCNDCEFDLVCTEQPKGCCSQGEPGCAIESECDNCIHCICEIEGE